MRVVRCCSEESFHLGTRRGEGYFLLTGNKLTWHTALILDFPLGSHSKLFLQLFLISTLKVLFWFSIHQPFISFL